MNSHRLQRPIYTLGMGPLKSQQITYSTKIKRSEYHDHVAKILIASLKRLCQIRCWVLLSVAVGIGISRSGVIDLGEKLLLWASRLGVISANMVISLVYLLCQLRAVKRRNLSDAIWFGHLIFADFWPLCAIYLVLMQDLRTFLPCERIYKFSKGALCWASLISSPSFSWFHTNKHHSSSCHLGTSVGTLTLVHSSF